VTAYDTAEASVEDSQPRELVSISINDGVTVYRHTSSVRDIVYGGNTYTAIPIERGPVTVTMPDKEEDCVLTLPIDHALARRYTKYGTPPKKIAVTIYRQNGGITEQIWGGEISSMSCEGRVASFRIPSRAGQWMLRPIPAFTASRACPFFVFDSNCGVSRTGSGPSGLPHKVTTTVLYVNGRDVRVDLSTITASDPLRSDWAEEGELLHVTTGERMTVYKQTDLGPGVSTVADLQLQAPIVGLAIGDSVEVYAGCPLDITTCNDKFDNKEAFGGLPQLPKKNPFTPAGWGVLGQT
jgi:hypothetical protein